MQSDRQPDLDSLEEALKQMRTRFLETRTTDDHLHYRYAQIVASMIERYPDRVSPDLARRLLADYFGLNIDHPSLTHRAILRAALALHRVTSDFHLVPFLRLWDLSNLREQDYMTSIDADGSILPSLCVRVAYAYIAALALRPDEVLADDELQPLLPVIQAHGLSVQTLILTQVRHNHLRHSGLPVAKLVSADGREFMLPATKLSANPCLVTDQQAFRLRVGDLYDCVVRCEDQAAGAGGQKGFLCSYGYHSRRTLTDVFPIVAGYVQHIDSGHGHIHIYDAGSRHFVARLADTACSVGDFVLFAPVVPLHDRFKSAFLHQVLPPHEGRAAFGLRQIRICGIDSTRRSALWTLMDSAHPVVETDTSAPACVEGMVWLDVFEQCGIPYPKMGDLYEAVIFLKRGKDGIKRPYVPYLQPLEPHVSLV